MYAVVFYIVSYVANGLLAWSALVITASVSSATSKKEARQGLLLGIVLVVLNVGLLFALADRSFAARPWRYAGILAGGALIFRFLTVRVKESVSADEEQPTSKLATLGTLVSGLDKTKKRMIVGAGVAVVVLLILGPAVTNSVRNAWDRQLQRNYARGEAEYLAQLEAEEGATLEAVESPQAPADQGTSSTDGLTPNGQARWMQLPDIIAGAPEDGSAARAILTWTAAGGDSGTFLFEVHPDQLGSGDDPSSMLDGQLFDDELGSCHVDDSPVSFQEFFDFVTARSETLGAIEFTVDGIVSSYAYSEGYQPAGGY